MCPQMRTSPILSAHAHMRTIVRMQVARMLYAVLLETFPGKRKESICCMRSQHILSAHVCAWCMQVARTLYAVLLETFPGKESIWRAAAQLEMGHGTPAQVGPAVVCFVVS